MLLLVTIFAVGFPLVAGRSDVAISTSPQQQGLRCTFYYRDPVEPSPPIQVPPAEAARICDNQVADRVRRSMLSPEARRVGYAVQDKVWVALRNLDRDIEDEQHLGDPPCPQGQNGDLIACVVLPGPVDPARLPRYLAEVGLTLTALRPARADDIAPPGSTLYAVDAGTACVTGWEWSTAVVGYLPGHRCLSP
jgi:hypothetical protein